MSATFLPFPQATVMVIFRIEQAGVDFLPRFETVTRPQVERQATRI